MRYVIEYEGVLFEGDSSKYNSRKTNDLKYAMSIANAYDNVLIYDSFYDIYLN